MSFGLYLLIGMHSNFKTQKLKQNLFINLFKIIIRIQLHVNIFLQKEVHFPKQEKRISVALFRVYKFLRVFFSRRQMESHIFFYSQSFVISQVM